MFKKRSSCSRQSVGPRARIDFNENLDRCVPNDRRGQISLVRSVENAKVTLNLND